MKCLNGSEISSGYANTEKKGYVVKRNVYLKMKSIPEAGRILEQAFTRQVETEDIPVSRAVGRVLAEPVFAEISSPNHPLAAMDGYAVQAFATFGVSENRPKTLETGVDAFPVNTGHPMPKDTDAVIMIEHVREEENAIVIEAPVFPWQNVRRMGEDIVATELLFPRYHGITPYCIGALVSGGVFTLKVLQKPGVTIIPTGSELVNHEDIEPKALETGQVIESNSHTLGAMVEACGGEFSRHSIVADDTEALKKALVNSIHQGADIVMMVGGSSAGTHDYTRMVIEELGEVLVHGVTMMPGKPVIIGRVENRPVFGMPGYPVSAIVAFEEFVRPLICRMMGRPDSQTLHFFERPTVQVHPTRKMPSKLGVEEFVRVSLGRVDERIVAATLSRGAGNITSITRAQGIMRIPAASEGISETETASATLLTPSSRLDNTLVIAGSHDNTLDILSDEIKKRHSHLSVSSSHLGSMGGLMAIKRGVCHLAGSHLLDTSDGSYNLSYIKRYLPDKSIRVVNLVFRDQGLIVAKNNPKNIKGIEDLVRKDIQFINRQGGSGTRILLDYRLEELNMHPDSISGYENEEYTHMAVAAAVISGAADAGLGIYAAAKALDLDFIPVVTEQYDLVMEERHFASGNFQLLLQTIRSQEFKDRVMAMGGYHTEKTGEVVGTQGV